MSKPYPCADACKCWKCATPTGIEVTGGVDPCCSASEGTYLLNTYNSIFEGDRCGLKVSIPQTLDYIGSVIFKDCTSPLDDCFECLPEIFIPGTIFIEECAVEEQTNELNCCVVYNLLVIYQVIVEARIDNAGTGGLPRILVTIEYYFQWFTSQVVSGDCSISGLTGVAIKVVDTYFWEGNCVDVPATVPHTSRVVSEIDPFNLYSGSYDSTSFDWGTDTFPYTYTLCDPAVVSIV